MKNTYNHSKITMILQNICLFVCIFFGEILTNLKIRFRSAAAICLLAGLLLCTGCAKSSDDQSSHVFVMGTVFEVRAIGSDLQTVLTEAEQTLYQTDALISWRQEDSLTAAFNQHHQQDMSQIADLVETALEISEESGGAFDPTVLPLSRVWDFDRMSETDFDISQMAVPDDAKIQEALDKVGFEKLSYDADDHVLTTSDDSTAIELGAIGKGYAADKAIAVLSEADVTGGMINAGSTISVIGHKADGSDFRVAVRDPRGEQSDYIGLLTLTDTSIGTSGDYERYFEQDGVRYHHILDPKTGYPADSGLMQVTVICESSMLADALSTACFVLGLDEGMALAKRHGAMALMVDTDRQVWLSSDEVLDILDFSGEEKGYSLKVYE